jgi:hypothetical protein
VVLCPCKSKHIPHKVSRAVFGMTLNFRLSHAYSVLSSQVAGENIYILRLSNIHHKKKGHFPLTEHEKEIKERTHKYIKFHSEKSPLDSVKIYFNFMVMKIRQNIP